jgi:hypothetical protein
VNPVGPPLSSVADDQAGDAEANDYVDNPGLGLAHDSTALPHYLEIEILRWWFASAKVGLSTRPE